MTGTTMALAALLEPFAAASLHEVAERAKVLPSRLRPVWSGATLRGPAYTVAQAAGDNTWLHRAIYEAPAGSVLVATTGSTEYGYWGELMARAALQKGLAGLVIEGGVRDIDALEGLGFPVFASAICIRGTNKDPGCDGSLGVPILLGDARVSTGDFVVADRDGIVVLPTGALKEIAARALAREDSEEAIREALARGQRLCDIVLPPADAGGDGYEP
jgi:4-hydroxy-4-methyl-2-oxoglutarate aldolase